MNSDLMKYKFEAIRPWLWTKSNCLLYHKNNHHIYDKWSFLSNNLPLKKLAIDRFYVLELDNNNSLSIKKKEKICKGIFLTEFEKLYHHYILENFLENFDGEDTPINKNLFLNLQKNWFNLSEYLHCEKDYAYIPELNPQNFSDYCQSLVDFKNHAFKEKLLNQKFLFVPACFCSFFSNKDYLYEIKSQKYIARHIIEKIKISKYDDIENILLFNELWAKEHSSQFDEDIAYFDPLLFLNDTYYSEFLEFILKPLEDKDLLKQLQFMKDFLDIINIFYFNAIISQQQFVLNRILLTASKTRKMSILDILKNMHKLIVNKNVEEMFFLNVVCPRIHIEYLIELITDCSDQDIESIRIKLYMSSPVIFDKDLFILSEIMFMIEGLFEKKPLLSFLEKTLNSIEIIYDTYNIDFTNKIKIFLFTFLSFLFDIGNQTGDRKYLNKTYMEDLSSILNKKKIFTTWSLRNFDFLQISKLAGVIDDNVKSSIFKKK